MRQAHPCQTRNPSLRANRIAKVENWSVARQRDYLLSIASHELKTHLTPLRLQAGLLEELARREESPEILNRRLKSYSGRLVRQVDRLSALVEELLDVSCINMGKLRLEKSKVCLSTLTKEVCERFSEDLKVSGSRLRLSLSGNIYGYWDKLRIEQIIANLLTNAVKYGRGRPIEITTARIEEKAIFRIADKGIGIRREDQERIFGLYERAVLPDHFCGSGLGLYIARWITEAHEGTLELASSFGKGSVFTVSLPCNQALLDRVAPLSASRLS